MMISEMLVIRLIETYFCQIIRRRRQTKVKTKKKILTSILLLIFSIFAVTACSHGGRSKNRLKAPEINYEQLNCRAVGDFKDGVQWVTRREVSYNQDENLYGLIDTKGQFLIEMTNEYIEVDSFYDDAAWVKVGNNQYRAIDKNGRYLTGTYEEVHIFSDDVAWVKSSGDWMVIDKNDNPIFTYDRVGNNKLSVFTDFSEGKCLVVLPVNEYGKDISYILDKNGNLLPLDIDISKYDYDVLHETFYLGKFVNGFARCGDKTFRTAGDAFRTLFYIKSDGSVLVLKKGDRILGGHEYSSAPDFENIEILAAGNFADGKANIIFEGKDELYYKVQIDEYGDFVSEPKNGLSASDRARAIMNFKSPKNSNITLSDLIAIHNGGFID